MFIPEPVIVHTKCSSIIWVDVGFKSGFPIDLLLATGIWMVSGWTANGR